MKNPNEYTPLDKRFTPTSLEQLSCPRMYYYNKLLPVLDKENPITNLARFDNVSATFGSAIHAGVAEFYRLKQTDNLSNEQLDNITCSVINHFCLTWIESKAKTDTYNLRQGIRILYNYCSNYRNDSVIYKPELIECQQWIEMPNGTMLGCIMDRAFTNGNYTAFTDTKTSGRPLTPFFFKKFESSFQFTTYYFILQEMFGNCDLVTCDAIHITKPGTKTTEPFVRAAFYRTPKQLKEWLNTYNNKTNWIIRGIELPIEFQQQYFYQEPQCCFNYGTCKYWKVCSKSEE